MSEEIFAKGSRVPAQNYDAIRRDCIRSGRPFIDPYFPANQESITPNEKFPFTVEWKRPKDITANPKLYSQGASRFDVEQGMLDDNWLVMALGSITQDPQLLAQVIPSQTYSPDAGVVKIRFWHFGEWVDIVVDDRLPTYRGRLIFIHSPDEDEFWSAFIEKACAKFYGSYEALKGGNTDQSLTFLTGGVVESIDLKNPGGSLFDRLLRHKKFSSLKICSIKNEGGDAKLESGLVKDFPYTITSATTVALRGRIIKLLRIRNPLGKKEWNGDWSDSSSIWKQISSDDKKELMERGINQDGDFWMSYEDFLKHFTDLKMYYFTISELQEDEKRISWHSIIINGEWSVGDGTAGGCRNFPTFIVNPQYVVELKEDVDNDGKCSVLISLMKIQKRSQKANFKDLSIGFSIYKAPSDDQETLTKKYIDYNYSTGTSGSFTSAHEVMKRFDLDPGRYIIIPCTFKPGEEGDFLLRIFTENIAEEKKGPSVPSGPSNSREKELYEMFLRLAGADKEMDAEELSDMLTASLAKSNDSAIFSLEASQLMIAMLDNDKNGTLNFDEFKTVLSTIGIWKKMFFKYDRDRTGTLERREIHSAIKSLGYDISVETLNVFFNRFARKRKYMKLDNFFACLCRIKIMTDTFDRVKSGDKVVLSKDEFMEITLGA